MEDNMTLWNKKQDELTVKDTLIISALAPVVAVGGVIVVGVALEGYNRTASKIRTIKKNRQDKKAEK